MVGQKDLRPVQDLDVGRRFGGGFVVRGGYLEGPQVPPPSHGARRRYTFGEPNAIHAI